MPKRLKDKKCRIVGQRGSKHGMARWAFVVLRPDGRRMRRGYGGSGFDKALNRALAWFYQVNYPGIAKG